MTAGLRALLPATDDGRSDTPAGARSRGLQVTVVSGMAAGWRWAQAHPRLVDTGLAVALFAFALPGLFVDDGPGGRPGALLAVAAAALVLRRRFPVAVWVIALSAGVLAMLDSGQGPTVALPTYLALYTVGSRVPLRVTVLAMTVTGAAYAVATAVVEDAWLDDHGDSPALSILALAGAAAAVGVAVRGQRAALRAAIARARQAEVTREEEAERRVTDERLRIARELHDIVAHHISVINVQAGVARHLLTSHPEQSREALGLVRDASKTVLVEMSAVVGLLRSRDEHAPTEPVPGLAGIEPLVDSVRLTGLALEYTVTGQRYELPPISDLTAYRVVQESLTNAVKYGGGAAELVIGYTPESVRIEVRNSIGVASTTADGGGHGLIGMRERVDAIRGRLVVGPAPDGSFTVRAEIPRDPR